MEHPLAFWEANIKHCLQSNIKHHLPKPYSEKLASGILARYKASTVARRIRDIITAQPPEEVVDGCYALADDLTLVASWLVAGAVGSVGAVRIDHLIVAKVFPSGLRDIALRLLRRSHRTVQVGTSISQAETACKDLGQLLTWTTEYAAALFDMFLVYTDAPGEKGFRIERASSDDIIRVVALDHYAFDPKWWINEDVYTLWLQECVDAFYVLRTPNRKVAAYYSMYFLRHDVRHDFWHGKIDEDKFHECGSGYIVDDNAACRGNEWAMFFSIVVDDYRSHSLYPRFLTAMLCLHGMERLKSVAAARTERYHGNQQINTVFAYPATPWGDRLIGYADFKEMLAPESNQDHKFYQLDFYEPEDMEKNFAGRIRQYGLTARSHR